VYRWPTTILATLLLLGPEAGAAQAVPAAATPTAAVAVAVDPALTAAGDLIGEALFLRGFYAANSLSYDEAGRLVGNGGEAVDWTLSGMNVLKVARVDGDAIELDGVRAAIRYNPDAHEFQRHALNDQKMRFVVKLAPVGQDGGVRQLRAAFAAIFAIGIDLGIEHSAPPLWSHYFDPSLAWPADGLTGQTIYAVPAPQGQPQDITPPLLAHRVDAHFTDAAAHDKVTGQVQLGVVVDAEGVPQRIVVARPLGYGLDEQAAEAVARWRFEPATRGGGPVACSIVVNIDFQTGQAR
jgi:TonB family protein